MATSSLTRRVTFAAAHRYRRPEWDDAKNEAVFGACARAAYHGHTYTCDVTVRGAIDDVTGMIVDLRLVDAAIAAEVTERFDHRNLSTDVEEFADGRAIPTCENIARLVATRVQAALGGAATVCAVTVSESPTLSATWRE